MNFLELFTKIEGQKVVHLENGVLNVNFDDVIKAEIDLKLALQEFAKNTKNMSEEEVAEFLGNYLPKLKF